MFTLSKMNVFTVPSSKPTMPSTSSVMSSSSSMVSLGASDE